MPRYTPAIIQAVALCCTLASCAGPPTEVTADGLSSLGLDEAPSLAGAPTQGHDLTWMMGTAGEPTDRDTVDLDPTGVPRTVVYVHTTERRNGVALSDFKSGTYDESIRRRVARPWEYLHEGLVYDELQTSGLTADGVEVSTYAVVVSEVSPAQATWRGVDPGAAQMGVALAEAIEAGAESLKVVVRVDVAPYPALPFMLGRVGEDEYARWIAERDEARLEQEHRFTRSPEVEAVTDLVEGDGGQVVQAVVGARALVVEASPEAALALLQLDAVASLELDIHGTPQAPGVDLGTMRKSHFTDTRRFHSAGYTGDWGFFPALIAAVAESDALEDEACMLADVAGCAPDRLKERYICDGAPCTSVANYPESQEDFHGTMVSSVLMADYEDGQGAAEGLGTGHGPTWERDGSGLAPEASLHYYRFVGGQSDASMAAECAAGRSKKCTRTDVFNLSYEFSPKCDPATNSTLEHSIENLFNAGVLPVISAGNSGKKLTSSTCTVGSPADTPMAFAVGGLKYNSGPYTSWGRMKETIDGITAISAYGGGDVVVNKKRRIGTMSMVDLAAIGQNLESVTIDSGKYGAFSTGAGTSVSAPMVAGASLLAKDWLLQNGFLWIDSPGRLHTVMLAMGDRGTIQGAHTWPACKYGDTIRCGADKLLGLGRLKMRLLAPGSGLGAYSWGMHTTTHTGVTADPQRYNPFPDPVASGTKMVKCVLQQREPMSSKSDISLIGLRVRVREPVKGRCTPGRGKTHFTRFDALYDDKHMVAVVSDEVSLGGRCIEVEQDRVALSTAGFVTTHAFCYASEYLDDDSP